MPDQRDVLAQLDDVVRLANEHGHYDAADWITARVQRTSVAHRIEEYMGDDGATPLR